MNKVVWNVLVEPNWAWLYHVTRYVHGGAIATVLDVAMSFCCFGKKIVTANLSVDYQRYNKHYFIYDVASIDRISIVLYHR